LYRDISFELKLDDFIIERYPGSNSPSWFESRVTLTDSNRDIHEPRRIYMNNILKHKGYRFYQSSYTSDEKGTILSVNRDWAGTLVTYAGYFLMALGMMLSLLNTNSRFRTLSRENALLKAAKKSLLLLITILSFQGISTAQDTGSSLPVEPVDQAHASLFGKLLVQDNGGRIEPVNTLSSEVMRKLSRKSTYNGMTPDQVFLGMMLDPAAWQHEPFIRATHPQIQEIMGSDDKYFAFISFFRDDNYILQDHVERAFHKKPALRSKFDNEIIRLDERVNICYLVFTGELLRILPRPNDSTHTWFSHQGIQGKVDMEDSVFVENIIPMYLQDVQQSMKTGDWKGPEDILGAITRYQEKYTGNLMPSPRDISLEIFLNTTDIFDRISNYYGIVGFLLLLLQFIALFYPHIKLKIPVIVSIILIITIFMIHTTGLGLRWYVSGHAPWSNGYEALTYIAWATVLAGLIFSGRSSITLSATAVLAFLILHTAHLSWMDPQITNLVPVLKSYWLVIHVATITASYGFLALGALLACINLLLMLMQTGKSFQYINLTIRELSNIIEMTIIAGLYLLVIGTFLGGVWANESWGRYWGWDPKETWALVTVLVYAFIAHMRMVPGLKGVYTFNLASLLGFSTVIMTYFGVNYYLSGLHSYAKGDPLPVPSFVYYTLVIIFVVAFMAFINKRRLEKDNVIQDR
jgi:cytochrome c-type biogenesis protein CcsB